MQREAIVSDYRLLEVGHELESVASRPRAPGRRARGLIVGPGGVKFRPVATSVACGVGLTVRWSHWGLLGASRGGFNRSLGFSGHDHDPCFGQPWLHAVLLLTPSQGTTINIMASVQRG
jgi:hypothetical protein